MFITLDYMCVPCLHAEERLVDRSERDTQTCETCQGKMVELASAPRGTVRGSTNRVKQ